ELSQKLKTSEEVNKVLLENVDKSIKGEIINQQKLFNEKNKELSEKINKDLELHLNNNQQLIKIHLENLNKGISQPLEKLNNVLLQSDERGRANGEGLRVDAIVFSADNRNNIAIDSKFPLKNYLFSTDSNLTEKEQKEFEKKFEDDVKEHVNKVAEYVSNEDGTKYAIMFVPSEVIFSKINEQRYYNIVEYKDLDKITAEISKFWDNFRLFKERWDKVVKSVESNNETIRKFNISTRKLIEDGEKIKNRESTSLKSVAKNQEKKTTQKQSKSKELNIYQKLGSIQAKVSQIFKNKFNKFQNYEYFTEFQALSILKPLLEDQKLTLTFSDDPTQITTEKIERE
ncbi:2722_t:CDS:2, partial [Funneliformis geosporum]